MPTIASTGTLYQASGTSYPVPKPSGLVAGDLLLAAGFVVGTPTLTPPSGFNVLKTDTAAGVTTFWHAKQADSTDAAASTFSYGASVSGAFGCQLMRITGADLADITRVLTSYSTTNYASAGSAPQPLVSPATGASGSLITGVGPSDGELVVRLAYWNFTAGSGTGTDTWSAGATFNADATIANATRMLATAYEALSGSSSAPTRTVTTHRGGVDQIGSQGKMATVTVKAAPTGSPAGGTVSVAGTLAVGSTLTATPAGWSNSPTSYSYQWQRSTDSGSTWTDLSGSTSSNYVVATGDAGNQVRVKLIAINGAGSSSPAFSSAQSIPAAPVNTAIPVITTDGSPATGETVTGSDGTWTGVVTSFTYQWYRGASPITGSTTSSYTLQQSDEGANIRIGVTAHGPGGNSSEVLSTAIVPAVTAPISDASFLVYYSGGTGNTTPANSIGGARGGTYPGGLSNLIGPIPGSVGQAGATFYRAVYLRNGHTISTAASGSAFVETAFASTLSHVKVGVPVEAKNTALPVLASGTTAPSGVTFTSATDSASGQAFGDLAPGDYRGLWLQFTLDPLDPSTSEDDFSVVVEFSAA